MGFIIHGFLLLRYWYCPAFLLGSKLFSLRCLILYMILWVFLPTLPFEQFIKSIIANLRQIAM